MASRKTTWMALTLATALSTQLGGQGGGQIDSDHSTYAAADVAYGARLYATHCAQCHGPTGDLVGGVDLRNGSFKSVVTDQQIMSLLTTGRSESGMPSFKFDNAELVATVAYLRNMKRFDVASVPVGDAARGQAIFAGKGGCVACHRTDGRGAGMAPDLGMIGAVRTAAALQTSILNPTAAMLPINRPVRAVMKDGKTINGRRLNEDTFSLQLMDERGALLSLLKDDLAEFTISTESPMPAYAGKLTREEVADLVAYLLSLKKG